MKFDGVTFNSQYLSKLTEKEALDTHLEDKGVQYAWRKKTPQEREEAMKEVHAMAVAKHAPKTPKQDGNTGANAGKVSKPEPKATVSGTGASDGEGSSAAK